MEKLRNYIYTNYARLLLIFGFWLLLIIGAFKSHSQTPSEVYREILRQEIKSPEIVLKQSLLETGHYKCKNCSMDKNNIFGFRYKGEYLKFNHWRRSVYYYRGWQKRKYKGGDYLTFLKEVGYATSKTYIEKLKQIKI